jgi:hypothetical protein
MEKMFTHINALYKWKIKMDLIVGNLKTQKIKYLDIAISKQTIIEMRLS